jgi:flagellar motility protein MotE (MotC chaperone)
MMRLPAPRLLPVTIVIIAILLGLKSVSLGATALASVPGATPSPVSLPSASHDQSPTPAQADVPSSPATTTARDWPLLQDLRRRSDELERRRRQLDIRDAALQAATQTVKAQLQQLNSLKSELAALEASREERRATDLLGIVKVYEAMKPADAATIFDALDVQLLVRIVDRMNERKAALVMGEMQPERARLVTQLLAAYRLNRSADPADARAHPDVPGPAGAG